MLEREQWSPSFYYFFLYLKFSCSKAQNYIYGRESLIQNHPLSCKSTSLYFITASGFSGCKASWFLEGDQLRPLSVDGKPGIQCQRMLLDTLGTLFQLETALRGAKEAGASSPPLSPVYDRLSLPCWETPREGSLWSRTVRRSSINISRMLYVWAGFPVPSRIFPGRM